LPQAGLPKSTKKCAKRRLTPGEQRQSIGDSELHAIKQISVSGRSIKSNQEIFASSTQMKITTTLLVLALVGLAITTQSHAETRYVDQRYGPGGNGSTNAPYNTIQAAINTLFCDVVIVMPGTYSENLVINKHLKLYGYDGPHTTRVEGSNGGTNTITIASGFNVTIEGLNISSGRHGVSQPSLGTLRLRNCIFSSNQLSGTYIATDRYTWPVVCIYNCIYVANGSSGIFVHENNNYPYYSPDLNVLNTVFLRNGTYAIESDNMSPSSNFGGRIVHNYNDAVDNAQGQYSANFLALNPPGANSFSLTPEFVGGDTIACQDFRLLPSSPCKDTGDPGIGFLDPDGTRNDIGAYGGPGAQTFYTYPNDGPIVRSVTIDQGMVPKGSTFTIRATGAVR